MNSRSILLCASLLLGSAGSASAQAVKLEFVGGLVNLTVQNAPARVVLAEWARLGGTQIVNGNNVTGAPMTLELIGVPERSALEVILRNVPGYIVSARRSPGVGGASVFDRVMIMPTTRAVAPASGATFGAPVQRPPVFNADQDDAADVTSIQRVQEQLRAAEAQRRAAEEAAARGGVVTGQPVVGQPGVVVRPGGAPQPFFPDPAPAAAPPPPAPGQTARPTNPFAPTPVPPTTQDGRPANTNPPR